MHRIFFLIYLIFIPTTIISSTNGAPTIQHKNQFVFKSNNLLESVDQNAKFPMQQLTILRTKILPKRQLDFNLDAEHEDGMGTDFAAAANANIWKSFDGSMRLDGTAKYSQHFDEFNGNGKAKYGGSLHFSVNY